MQQRRTGPNSDEVSMSTIRTWVSKPVLAGLAMTFLAGRARAEVPLTWDSTGHVTVPTFVNG
jgi:hypothetical protein